MTAGELKEFLNNCDNDAVIYVYNFGDSCTSTIHSIKRTVFGNNAVLNVDRTNTLLANYHSAKSAMEYHDIKMKEEEEQNG